MGTGRRLGSGLMPHRFDVVPVPVEGDHVLGEQGAQHGDLLVDPPAAVGEGLVERSELRFRPAQPDSQPQPALGQRVDLCRLLRHHDRLALRKGQDGGHQLHPPRDCGEVAEQHQRLVDVLQGVRTDPLRTISEISPRHVVPGAEVDVAQVLRCLGDVTNSVGLGHLQAREQGADPHPASQHAAARSFQDDRDDGAVPDPAIGTAPDAALVRRRCGSTCRHWPAPGGP
jgi:hypothetical protein